MTDKIQDKYGDEIIRTKRLKQISQMNIDSKGMAEISCTKRLKKLILAAPEKAFLIEDMAQHIGLSPYHMIRKFKASCGLTPHQFQMQCRVRKAQKLLEEGKNKRNGWLYGKRCPKRSCGPDAKVQPRLYGKT